MDTIAASLLDLVVCPVTHSRLRQEGDFLVAEKGGLRYPIKDGLPVLLPDAAEIPAPYHSLAEFKAAMAAQAP